MSRTFMANVGAFVLLASMEAASASDQIRRYKIENAWPSKTAAQRPGGAGSGVDKGVRGYAKGGNETGRPKAKAAHRRGQ
jgi:hypothetical protein